MPSPPKYRPLPPKYWPPVAPGQTLSSEEFLAALEKHWAELEQEYRVNPCWDVKEKILYEAQRVMIHRTTQGKPIHDILPRLQSLDASI